MALDLQKNMKNSWLLHKLFLKSCEKLKVNMNLYKLTGNEFSFVTWIWSFPLLEINSQEILNRKGKQKLLFMKIFHCCTI